MTAFISVNKWSVAKTSQIHNGLAEQQLFALQTLKELSDEEIARRLLRAGYSRAEYVRNLIAKRLSSFAQGFHQSDLEKLRRTVAQRDAQAVETQLLGRPGIGPTVLRTFKDLQAI